MRVPHALQRAALQRRCGTPVFFEQRRCRISSAFWPAATKARFTSASRAISVDAFEQHKSGAVAGFTKQYKVHQLVYFEQFASILDARARERVLKRWRRAWKIKLIEGLNPRDLTPELVNL